MKRNQRDVFPDDHSVICPRLRQPRWSSRIGRGLGRSISTTLLGASIIFGVAVFVAGQTTPPVQPAPAPAAKPPATGVINGIVLSDDGQPLADAQVFLSSAGEQRYVRPGQIGQCTIRRPVSLHWPARRVYHLRAESAGYTMPDLDGPQNRAPIYRVGANVTLTMLKGGVITGSVTDATGAPLIEMPVRALRVARRARTQAPNVLCLAPRLGPMTAACTASSVRPRAPISCRPEPLAVTVP